MLSSRDKNTQETNIGCKTIGSSWHDLDIWCLHYPFKALQEKVIDCSLIFFKFLMQIPVFFVSKVSKFSTEKSRCFETGPSLETLESLESRCDPYCIYILLLVVVTLFRPITLSVVGSCYKDTTACSFSSSACGKRVIRANKHTHEEVMQETQSEFGISSLI